MQKYANYGDVLGMWTFSNQTKYTYKNYKKHYTQYPFIRNGDQRWALAFLKNYQFLDADRFLILQAWVLAVS